MDSKNKLKKRKSIIALFFKALTWLIPLSLCYIILHILANNDFPPVANNIKAITFYYRLVCFVIFFEMLRLFFNDLYVFGTVRIINILGIISLHSRRTTVAYEDIRDVGIAQSLLGRLFDYGTLIIGTAGLDTHEIKFKDLNQPSLVADFVREKMTQAEQKVKAESDYTTNNE